MLSQGACEPRTSEDGQSQYRTTSKTTVRRPRGMYLSRTFLFDLELSDQVGRLELGFLVEETAGFFTKVFIGSAFNKFLIGFQRKKLHFAEKLP